MRPEFLETIIIVLSLIILFIYSVQVVLAISRAYVDKIIQILLTPKNIYKIWFWFVASLVIPLAISVGSDLFNLSDIKDQNQLIIISVLSLLSLFITLEFSLIVSHSKKIDDWQNFLITALFLDICSVIIVSVINLFSLDSVIWVIFLGSFAFISSFVIILFAKVASEDYGSKYENDKPASRKSR